MENVWKGYNFQRYNPHDKGPFLEFQEQSKITTSLLEGQFSK